MKKFPDGFLWGAATASYQVEGGIENCDWALGAREGKVPVCGKATDHYNRYEGDFDLAKSLGHNAHRFSIEWARIEPEEGKFNDQEIEHYRSVIRALKMRGMEPFVTLWHFTLPIWFYKKGGFKHPDGPKIFARYCGYVVERLGREAKFWMTINEPLVWASGGYRTGKWPPFEKSILSFISITNPLIEAHKLAYEKIKLASPEAKVGIAKHNIYFTNNFLPWNYLLAKFMNWFWNERFLNKISFHQDFIGLNHYFYKRFGGNGNLPKSDMGWDIFPEAIYHCLLDLEKYDKPIYITENGLADEKDEKRADYIRGYVSAVKKAVDEGVPVKGFFYWSLLDNYEWAYGFEKRFGLVAIDYKNMKRTLRKSAGIYADIAKNNAI